MQVRCLSALAMIGHESALPLAAKLLGHPEAKVAAEAARVLGEISVASAAIPLLVAWEEMEKDRKKSGDAAKSAEERLRILGSPLKDALARLTGQRFDSPDDVRKWLVSNRIPGQPPEELPEAGCVHLLQIELARREAKGNPPGVIVRELWRGIRGKTLEAFAASGALACPATDFDLLAGFETPYNIGDNYGSRIRGYLRPPVDGEYQFWICSDNNAELYLGADDSPAGKSLIAWIRGTAYNTGWAEPRNWERYPSQLSKPVRLAAGRCYYIEALQKEEDGGDHLAVAWQVPGGSREVIPGRCLSPYLFRPARTGDDGLDRGPVAWWRFNESAGITAFDSSGNDHTGSLTGGPAWDAAGKQGGALRLDGVDDDVRVSRSSDLEPASVTVSAWIRLDGAPPSWANLLRKTWRNRAGPTSASYALQLNPEGADPGMIAFVTGYEGGNDILKSPKASIPGGAWVHVAGTYDPGAPVPQKRLYVNGELVAFKTLTRPLVYDTTATGDLYLGQNGSRSERFKGWLDDVQVHDRALPAEEIRAALAPVAAR